MSVETLPAPAQETTDPEYWHGLINEQTAADFLGLTDRTMQAYRCRGSGPKFIKISARAVRYRRRDLQLWADAHLRASTSDPGPQAA